MERRARAQWTQAPSGRREAGRRGGGAKDFAKVGDDRACKGSKCLAPGDTMHIPGHIRILVTVERRDGAVEFTTVER